MCGIGVLMGIILEGLLGYLCPIRMMYLLKLPFDQNIIMINHKSNSNFNSHIIFSMMQIGLFELLVLMAKRLPPVLK
jgi:hypothetical protein